MTDDEFYDALNWANQTLMKNYFDKQKKSTLDQIDRLYKEKDITFRGFRHNAGAGPLGEKNKKNIQLQGSEVMDGLVNWESSQTADGERFSKNKSSAGGKKSLKSFDLYVKRKEKRAAEKLLKINNKEKRKSNLNNRLFEVSEALKKNLAV